MTAIPGRVVTPVASGGFGAAALRAMADARDRAWGMMSDAKMRSAGKGADAAPGKRAARTPDRSRRATQFRQSTHQPQGKSR